MTSRLHLLLSSGPACGRQLANHRELRSQDQQTMTLASSWDQFRDAVMYAELGGRSARQAKACRWCARAAGLIPPVQRPPAKDEDGSDELATLDEMEEEETDE